MPEGFPFDEERRDLMQKRGIIRWEPEFIRRVLVLAVPMILQAVVTAIRLVAGHHSLPFASLRGSEEKVCELLAL